MMRLVLALALGASAQTRISLTQAARQPTLTTDDVEQLLAVAQRPVTPQGLVIVERTEYEVEDPGGASRMSQVGFDRSTWGAISAPPST